MWQAPEKDLTAEIKKQKKQEDTYISFEPETVYDLLVAELGGQRQRYDLALGNYLKQAHQTRDVGVAKRAYQVATFVNAKQAALDAAMLWVALAPDDINALRASAFELMQNNHWEQAIKRMDQLLVYDQGVDLEDMAHYAKGLSEVNKNNVSAAFSRAIIAYPQNYSLSLAKITLLMQLKQYQKALVICNKLIKKQAELVKALALKGRLLSKMGRTVEAETVLEGGITQYPEQTFLRLLYARVLIGNNKLDQAYSQFRVLLQQSPDNAEVILSLGLISMDLGKEQKAENYLHRLLATGKSPNTAHFYLGKLYETQQRWADAKRYYSAVIPGEEFLMAQATMTKMLENTGQWLEAREQLKSARKHYPEQAANLFLLEGDALSKRREYDQALTLYNDALGHFPEDLSLLYNRATTLGQLDRLALMENDLRKILALQPNDLLALNALGYILADQNIHLEEASRLLNQAYEINKSDPMILDSLGWLEYRMGNLNKALEILQEAYMKLPSEEIIAHLSEVLWMLGKKDEARALWLQGMKGTPPHKILRETINRLDKAFIAEYDRPVVKTELPSEN
ncbi:MAG: tetratricopeptide repeat protein [Endozoicomonas sp. (ex Botrylloides leachii)]|nr:tetratricopeptide repeat protein [Endozoicomonas sp. (ex Botrylloides leachii)]